MVEEKEFSIDGAELITIRKSTYDSLCDDAFWRECVESAGVDNWSGMDYAYELMGEEDED